MRKRQRITKVKPAELVSAGRPTTIYVGFDGSYVLSLSPLVKRFDKSGGNYFLSPFKGKCLDIQDGTLIFGVLGLQMFEVTKLEVTVKESPTLVEGGTK